MLLSNAKIDTSGFMVALFPDQSSCEKIKELQESLDIPRDKRISLKEVHCTLRWWKYEAFNDKEAIVSAFEKEVSFNEPVTCNTFGFELFGKEKDTLVLTIKNKQLDYIQKHVDKVLQDLGVPKSDFPTYKAHLTLANDIKEVPETSYNIKKIVFDNINFRNNKDEVFWEEGIKMVTAQEVQDLRDLNKTDRYNTYLQTGHEGDTKNILWALINGNIEWTDDKQNEDSFHHIQWDPLVLDNAFYGRLEDRKGFKILTITVPERWKYRSIPQGLIDKLQEKFHPDEIKVFG